MRLLEVRRHSYTKKAGEGRGQGSSLSQAGVELARRIAVRDGGRALVVAHGGLIEPGLVTICPDGDLAAWGGAFAHCEGARLTYTGEALVEVKLLRVDA